MATPSGGALVCRCFEVADGRIRKAIRDLGLRQVEEVTAATGAGGGCGSCWNDLQRLLDEAWGRPPARDVPDASGLTAAQKRGRIVAFLESDGYNVLEKNGLVMQLVEVGGDRVLVRFSGDRVGGQDASFLAIKRWLVQRLGDACGARMQLVELNVLERLRDA
jgi:NifU-like protein